MILLLQLIDIQLLTFQFCYTHLVPTSSAFVSLDRDLYTDLPDNDTIGKHPAFFFSSANPPRSSPYPFEDPVLRVRALDSVR